MWSYFIVKLFTFIALFFGDFYCGCLSRKFNTVVRVSTKTKTPCDLSADAGVSLKTFMELPIEQYALIKLPLNAKLSRLPDESPYHFELIVPPVQFFSVSVCPKVYCNVTIEPEFVFISSNKCILSGSTFVEDIISNCFIFDVKTRISYLDTPTFKSLFSSTDIFVRVDPPPPFNLIPKDILESTGNLVMEAVTKQLEGGFLRSLATDYNRWAKDRNYRTNRLELSSESKNMFA